MDLPPDDRHELIPYRDICTSWLDNRPDNLRFLQALALEVLNFTRNLLIEWVNVGRVKMYLILSGAAMQSNTAGFCQNCDQRKWGGEIVKRMTPGLTANTVRGNTLDTDVGSTLVIWHAIGGVNLTFPVGGAGGLGTKCLNIQVPYCLGPLAGRRICLTLQAAEFSENGE